jgi:5'-nucleotidase
MSDEMVREVISKKFITLRDGGAELLKRLFEKGIPLIIFSASRAPLIRETLQQSGRLTSNIHIVSNEFEKDKTGKFLKIKGSLIHSLNKNELVLKKENWYADIKKERKNIILLGDSLSDADMATDQDGFNILRIGFLNDLNSLLPLFTSKFDAVLKEDTSILFLKDLIPE